MGRHGSYQGHQGNLKLPFGALATLLLPAPQGLQLPDFLLQSLIFGSELFGVEKTLQTRKKVNSGYVLWFWAGSQIASSLSIFAASQATRDSTG